MEKAVSGRPFRGPDRFSSGFLQLRDGFYHSILLKTRGFLRGFSEVYPVPLLLLTVQWLPKWHGLQSILGEAMSYCHYPRFLCRGLPAGIMHRIYPWNAPVDGAWQNQT